MVRDLKRGSYLNGECIIAWTLKLMLHVVEVSKTLDVADEDSRLWETLAWLDNLINFKKLWDKLFDMTLLILDFDRFLNAPNNPRANTV